MQIQVDSTGLIVGRGLFTADHEDPDISIIEIADSEAEIFDQPGAKRWDGTSVMVMPPGPGPEPTLGPDPRVAAVQALISTATSPEQADALRQFAEAFGIALP